MEVLDVVLYMYILFIEDSLSMTSPNVQNLISKFVARSASTEPIPCMLLLAMITVG